MSNKWLDIFRSGALERCGASCATIRELAAAIEKDRGTEVSPDALFSAHKRHSHRLKLKASLMDYMGQEIAGKAPKVKPEDLRFELSPEKAAALKKAKRVIVTSALNNTQIDPAVWEALLRYAKKNKAEIVVLPVRYKNPTNRVDGKVIDENAWWPSEVTPYLTDDLLEIHEHLWIMGHVRISATAVHPLSGLDSLSRGASAIFGHGQLAMNLVPTPQKRLPKVLYTTGSVSVKQYSDTKAGIRGDFFHGKGALVVELDGPRFHIRALVADEDGGFYDLDHYYHAKGIEKSSALALVTGDEHALFADPKCKHATYLDKKSITSVCKPEVLIRHDVFDGYSISHHHKKNPVTKIAKHKFGLCDLRSELAITTKHIDQTTPKNTRNLIVSSNHHDHLLQWLKETTPAEEPWNAEIWIELWAELVKTISVDNGATCADPFALWAGPRLQSETEFMPAGEGRSIAGIGIDFHGHQGSNGARGSINQFAKVGIKTIIGHSHTPGIKHGCYQVGTSSSLRLEYNKGGLSSWVHCHCLIHPNGKRQLIMVIDGHWRL